MNTLHLWISRIVLLGLAPVSWAQSTTDLIVTGSIVPAACTPQFSTQAVHFGKFSFRDLAHQDHTALGEQAHTLVITCEAPAAYALRATDNRKGSAHGKPDVPAPLGMGFTPMGERIGSFHLVVRSEGSNIDGRPVYLSVGPPDGGSWSPASVQARPISGDGGLLALVETVGATSGPTRVREALLQVVASAHVAPASGLTLNQEVVFDGHATLELIYL
ncbi:MAG: DUF1120 domain-containing protein [Pseudomonas sp.]|nr:DUF1120 domain-containing protein [Pseudomonas sp.]